MTNELVNPRKLQLEQVIALKFGGMKLKNALKQIGISYSTYWRAWAAYPNLFSELIREQKEIDLDQNSQEAGTMEKTHRGLSTKSDSSGTRTIEELLALGRRLATIRAEMVSSHIEVMQPPVDQIPGKSDAEVYLESIRDRIKLQKPVSAIDNEDISSSDKATGNLVEGSS